MTARWLSHFSWQRQRPSASPAPSQAAVDLPGSWKPLKRIATSLPVMSKIWSPTSPGRAAEQAMRVVAVKGLGSFCSSAISAEAPFRAFTVPGPSAPQSRPLKNDWIFDFSGFKMIEKIIICQVSDPQPFFHFQSTKPYPAYSTAGKLVSRDLKIKLFL